MDFCIGRDILDIGSRRAEHKIRHYGTSDATSTGGNRMNDFMASCGPTHFDVPNVSNVRL
jgi:hypothetical protein